LHEWFVAVFPGGVTHANVWLDPNVVTEQAVPFAQFVSLQQVSSHLFCVHTPERQSLSREQPEPALDAPGVARAAEPARMQ
jgi:hypothetical protein